MKFGLISFSYEKTPIEIREKINFSSKQYNKIYSIDFNEISELIVLSTCNRTELYFIYNEEIDRAVSVLIEKLHKLFDISKKELNCYKNIIKNFKVIEHLFKVASGLKSQVIGEQQILGQVKEAHKKALDQDSSGKFLNFIYRKAITIAKEVRTETGLSDKNLSLSSVAVSFIERKYQNLSNKKVLVIGVGKMSRIVLEILQDQGINKVYATNRTHGKVVKISKYFQNVIPVNYDKLHETISKVDIVISSTSAPHYLVYKDKLENYYNQLDKNMIFVDLGVPRDIDSQIAEWPEIDIYNLDQLHTQMEKNEKFRQQEIDNAEEIIKKGLQEVKSWQQCQKIVPVIKSIKKHKSRILNKKLERLFNNLQLEQEEKNEIEKFARYLSKDLFNDIILNLREFAQSGECDLREVNIIKEIFDFDSSE